MDGRLTDAPAFKSVAHTLGEGCPQVVARCNGRQLAVGTLGDAARGASSGDAVPDGGEAIAFVGVTTFDGLGVTRCAHMADPGVEISTLTHSVCLIRCTRSGTLLRELVARLLNPASLFH